MKVSLPPVPQSLEKLREALGEMLAELPDEESRQIVLAVQEAAANYVQHAERAEAGCALVVDVELDAARLTVRIPGFCRRGVERTISPRPLDQVRPGGLGTHFIREIMDRVEYRPGPQGFMTLVLIKTLRSGPGAPGRDRPNED